MVKVLLWYCCGPKASSGKLQHSIIICNMLFLMFFTASMMKLEILPSINLSMKKLTHPLGLIHLTAHKLSAAQGLSFTLFLLV